MCTSMHQVIDTVDEIGAKTIEIGTTQHDKKRVSVLLCINRAGGMVTPLVIHRCYEKKRFIKTHQFFKKTIITSDGKPLNIWVTYARKAWLNGAIMTKWLELVHASYVQSTKRTALRTTQYYLWTIVVHTKPKR